MEYQPTIQLLDCPDCGKLAAATVPEDPIMVVVSPIPHLSLGAEAGPLEKEYKQKCVCPEGHAFYVYSLASGIITL